MWSRLGPIATRRRAPRALAASPGSGLGAERQAQRARPLPACPAGIRAPHRGRGAGPWRAPGRAGLPVALLAATLGAGGCALLPFADRTPRAEAPGRVTGPEAASTRPDDAATPSRVPASAPAAAQPPRAGSYAGLAVLTAFHGDCNAGGTGLLTLRGQEACYHDAHTLELCGPLRPDGTVEVAAGRVRLVARFAGTQASGSITGGVCEYRFDYVRQAS